VEKSNSGNVAFQLIFAELKYRLRRAGDRKQAPRRLVDTDIGRLCRQHHRDQQLERRGVFEFGGRLRIGLAQAAKDFGALRGIHAPPPLFFARARAIAARTASLPASTPALRALSSSARSRSQRCRRALRAMKRPRYCKAREAASPESGGALTIEMQSTGQGAMHSSQPVHSSTSTVCITFEAPRIA